ncbi:hypothetical protein RUM44_003896 [Polyplax serrata]|uniref:Uncharacterized protein n=1 Tax=Polyplax serrata TaxID=468196 RepID=A0ABR1B1A2_POLSC
MGFIRGKLVLTLGLVRLCHCAIRPNTGVLCGSQNITFFAFVILHAGEMTEEKFSRKKKEEENPPREKRFGFSELLEYTSGCSKERDQRLRRNLFLDLDWFYIPEEVTDSMNKRFSEEEEEDE